MLIKLLGWEDRLAQYLLDCTQLAFVWGMHDCALFAAGAVHAMTGEDLGAIFRGQYNDALGSERVLRRYMTENGLKLGGGSTSVLAYVIDDILREGGARFQKSAGFISRGDIILLNIPDTGESIGVCDGVNMLAVRVDGGLTNLPRESVRSGWRLP